MQIGVADKAAARLVKRVVADDVRQVAQPPRDLDNAVDVVALEILLDRVAVHGGCGREIVPAEEERKHGRRAEPRVV